MQCLKNKRQKYQPSGAGGTSRTSEMPQRPLHAKLALQGLERCLTLLTTLTDKREKIILGIASTIVNAAAYEVILYSGYGFAEKLNFRTLTKIP